MKPKVFIPAHGYLKRQLLSALVPGAIARPLHAPSHSVLGEESCRWSCYCPHSTEEEAMALDG